VVAESFNETFSVGRPVEEAWDVLVDVARVSGWVSVVDDVTEHEHLSRYSAVLEDRLGPFKLKADLDVEVTSVEAPSKIVIRADGEDRQVGSRITIGATLALEEVEGGCRVMIEGQYEVTGRIATMGASTIRHKADAILEEFMEAAKRDLGDVA